MSVLSIKNLSVSFGAFEAVKSISFDVQKGEMLALVGESGSGKSLTALSCLGLQPESARVSGSIVFDSQEMVGAPATRLRSIRGKRVGIIFQEPMTSLNPLHTIGKQIAEALEIHRATPGDIKARVTALLEHVGMAHFKDRLDSYPHQLSGGERQRVMIAMAIANGPELLIADEPTTAVDVTIQAKLLTLLKELQRSRNMAILFITHDLTIVKRLADRVAVMREGQIVEQNRAAKLFASPQHEYTKKLLASEPKPLPPAPLPTGEPPMRCENLKVHFPIKRGVLRRTVGVVKAVDDVSINVPAGATLGIVGESGSGKTTLAFALLRLIKSDGPIVFLGQPINGLQNRALRPLRQKMQIVFQDPYTSLNPRMSVRQIIEEGLLVHAPTMSAAEREQAVETALKEVGLTPEMKDRFAHEFSGGQRQRISIARAMVLRPAFVVLDEPTSALDLTVQAQIIALLRHLQQAHGVSYLFISHDLRVVRALASRIAVMRAGKIVEEGTMAEIFENPKTEYAKTLIDAAFLKG